MRAIFQEMAASAFSLATFYCALLMQTVRVISRPLKHGRVRFDLVVQIDFSFIVCPLVIIFMFIIVIVQLSGS